MAFIEAKQIQLERLSAISTDAYKIPEYQRPYAWKKEQWEDLINDITSLEN